MTVNKRVANAASAISLRGDISRSKKNVPQTICPRKLHFSRLKTEQSLSRGLFLRPDVSAIQDERDNVEPPRNRASIIERLVNDNSSDERTTLSRGIVPTMSRGISRHCYLESKDRRLNLEKQTMRPLFLVNFTATE